MLEFFSVHPYISASILSLLLGAVVGLERETTIQRGGDRRFAGIRTFSFIGLMGGICGVLGQLISPLLTVAGFLSVVILVAMGYMAEQKQNKIGLTTEITSLLVFLIGLLVAYDQTFLGVLATIAIITMLSQRQLLHGFAGKIENHELLASIKFAIIAFVVLPLLPDRTFDPWDALNPHKIWLIVVLISGLSFAGYIFSKIFGERKGMTMTGFFGGLVSSTALNLSLAEKSKSKKSSIQTSALLLALFLAQAASLILTQIELFILNKELFLKALIPVNSVILLLIVFSVAAYKSYSHKEIQIGEEVEMKSPFTLSHALFFGGIFSAMMLTIKVLFMYIGNTGLYITAMFSGLVSLDAMTVTVAEVTGNGIDISAGFTMLLLGIIMSVVQKISVLLIFAEKKYKKIACAGLIATIILLGAFIATS